MARVTRSSARRAPSQSSTLDSPSTTANASPIFSARTSVKALSETPITSDKEDSEEEDQVELKKKEKKFATTAKLSSKTMKRKKSEQASSDEDSVKLEATATATAIRASKRRVSANRAYVEITATEVKRTQQKVNSHVRARALKPKV